MTEAYILDLPPDRMEGDVVVTFFFEDDRPLHGAAALLDWRLNGHLTDLLLEGKVTGGIKDSVIVRNNRKLDAEWSLFLGGGNRSRLSKAHWERLLKKALQVCMQAGFDRIAFCLDSQEDVPATEIKKLVKELLAALNNAGLECLFSFDTVPVLPAAGGARQGSLL